VVKVLGAKVACVLRGRGPVLLGPKQVKRLNFSILKDSTGTATEVRMTEN